MTLKALTAILMTVVVSLAALASEQRRMHVAIEIADDGDAVHMTKEVRKTRIMESSEDVVRIEADSSHDDYGIHPEEEHEVVIIRKQVNVAN